MYTNECFKLTFLSECYNYNLLPRTKSLLSAYKAEELIVFMFSCQTLLLGHEELPSSLFLVYILICWFSSKWLSLSSCIITGRMFSFMCFRILPHMIYVIVKWQSQYLSNFKEFYFQLAMIQELKLITFIVFIFLQWKKQIISVRRHCLYVQCNIPKGLDSFHLTLKIVLNTQFMCLFTCSISFTSTTVCKGVREAVVN